MSKTNAMINNDSYEKDSTYNHEEHYYFVEDQAGSVYKTYYGSIFGDWYITGYENVETKDTQMKVDNIKYYYKRLYN